METPKDRYAAIRAYLEAHPGQGGIIYCLTRRNVEEICEKLIRDGFSVTRYHAGLSDAERQKNQDDFIYDRVPVMVATNAFGMGIDRSDVRFVLHCGKPTIRRQDVPGVTANRRSASCIIAGGMW